MPDTRLPKKCFLHHLRLFNSGIYNSKFNWVAQVDKLLQNINGSDIWESTDAKIWKQTKVQLLRDYKVYLKRQDYEHFSISTFCQINIDRSLEDNIPSYLISNCSFALKRIFAQLRVASKFVCIFVYKGFTYRLDASQICSICNMNEEETLVHFIMKCPIYNHLRNHYIAKYCEFDSETLNSKRIVQTNDVNCMKNFFCYIANALLLQAFIMNKQLFSFIFILFSFVFILFNYFRIELL